MVHGADVTTLSRGNSEPRSRAAPVQPETSSVVAPEATWGSNSAVRMVMVIVTMPRIFRQRTAVHLRPRTGVHLCPRRDAHRFRKVQRLTREVSATSCVAMSACGQISVFRPVTWCLDYNL